MAVFGVLPISFYHFQMYQLYTIYRVLYSYYSTVSVNVYNAMKQNRFVYSSGPVRLLFGCVEQLYVHYN
jgi:hypothetical protein